MSVHRSTPTQDALARVRPEDDATGAAVAQLIGQAKHRVTAVLSGDEEQAEAVTRALEKCAEAGGSRLAVRLLCSPRALETRLIRSVASHPPGWEVRVIHGDIGETLVVDGGTALVRTAPASDEGQVISLEDPATARTMELLLAGAWRRAVPLEDYLRLDGRLRTDLGKRILERLCAGCTDAVAAREMKVSLRTYRRHVAEIMRELGANSRFQAGARAVELRILLECN